MSSIRADESGINSQNTESFTQTKDPQNGDFLGSEEDLDKNTDLSNDFARRIIQQIGNYGNIYDCNMG